MTKKKPKLVVPVMLANVKFTDAKGRGMTGARWVREPDRDEDKTERWFLIQEGVPDDEAEGCAWASVMHCETSGGFFYEAAILWDNWVIPGKPHPDGDEYNQLDTLEDAKKFCETELTMNGVRLDWKFDPS
jgi:hypothetical protein